MAVVVTQWVERLLPVPEVRSSNPGIGKIYIEHLFTVNCNEKTKIKRLRMVHFLKIMVGWVSDCRFTLTSFLAFSESILKPLQNVLTSEKVLMHYLWLAFVTWQPLSLSLSFYLLHLSNQLFNNCFYFNSKHCGRLGRKQDLRKASQSYKSCTKIIFNSGVVLTTKLRI